MTTTFDLDHIGVNTNTILENHVNNFIERALKRREFLIREALSKWVSECEPQLIMRYNKEGFSEFIGLGRIGSAEVIIPASGSELKIEYNRDTLTVTESYHGFLT